MKQDYPPQLPTLLTLLEEIKSKIKHCLTRFHPETSETIANILAIIEKTIPEE